MTGSKYDTSALECLIDRTQFIEDIKKRCHQPTNRSKPWTTEASFKIIINGLIPYIEKPEPTNSNGWTDDMDIISLVEDLNKIIIDKIFHKGDEVMSIINKLVVVTGVLSLVAIALYAYRCQKNKSTSSGNKENLPSIPEVIKKVGKVGNEIILGFQANPETRPNEAPTPAPNKPNPAQPVDYHEYILLLIIEAKRLDKQLKEGDISKEAAEKIIANARLGYCFAELDEKGKQVLEAVECSDEDINYESVDSVFLHLTLSAKPEIIVGKRDRLGLREAMHPGKPVKIKKPKILKTPRSIMSFYSI